ncbi:MAG: hypothetical protein LBJ00_11800 [Planctomycetaceae bacterium]|nr:hypothetical protein [Planctomycetaceae bacterium]
MQDNFVTKIQTIKDCNFFVGTYGGGLAKSTKPFNIMSRKPKPPTDKIKKYSVLKDDGRLFLACTQPPTLDELRTMYSKLNNLKTPLPEKYAIYTEATLKFRSCGKPATRSVRQSQQREAVVQGRRP